MSDSKPVLGVIGGSGVYEIDGLQNKRWKKVSSSFGEPSDELLFGNLNGHEMVFCLDMGGVTEFLHLKLIIELILTR